MTVNARMFKALILEIIKSQIINDQSSKWATIQSPFHVSLCIDIDIDIDTDIDVWLSLGLRNSDYINRKPYTIS